MRTFLDENFLLNSPAAQRLYHEFAAEMPIIDYHNHLPPQEIAQNRQFENLTRAWLWGDHYKWRAMRTHGIPERYCTGDATDREKFEKWAETVPFTLRNPLYHWTHLELQRYFGIREILSPETAREIYEATGKQLRSQEFAVRGLLKKMKVQVLCTTDDPVDSLEWHRALAENSDIKVLPAFRPDKALAFDDAQAFNAWTDRLEGATGKSIRTYSDFLAALHDRHDFFARHGARVSDHGLEHLYAIPGTESEFEKTFARVRSGTIVSPEEQIKLKSALLHEFALWNHEKGWVQQFHLGAMRNNNTRAMRTLGPDTGWDSIGDFSQARQLASFLDRLDRQDKLAKTILYNLNPADNEIMATMIGNFNDGSIAGKVQFGSAWWFLDQKDGIKKQLNALSNMSLLPHFIGMLTDSRSFLSFPRHEYFRRILCDLFGRDMENGELPHDFNWIGKVVQDICFYNAEQYFGF